MDEGHRVTWVLDCLEKERGRSSWLAFIIAGLLVSPLRGPALRLGSGCCQWGEVASLFTLVAELPVLRGW